MKLSFLCFLIFDSDGASQEERHLACTVRRLCADSQTQADCYDYRQ